MPRRAYAPGYRILVKTAITRGLRAVFDDFYTGDPSFRKIVIDAAYPLDRTDFTHMIVVWFRPSVVEDVGIGNIEYLYDSNGTLRPFLHSRFEGRVELELITMRPTDLDQLVDAVVEAIRFGRLEEQTNNLFTTIEGVSEDSDAQVIINRDRITDSGDEQTDAPWGAETGNVSVWRTRIGFDIHGGYYSVDRASATTVITEIDVYPYHYGSDKPEGEIVVAEWSDTEHREESGLVWSTGVIEFDATP
jgi:hypothetical protein